MIHRLGRWVTLEATANALALGTLVALICVAGWLWGSIVTQQTLATMLTALVAVASLVVFSGNSGALSFGHVAFMAIGAQMSVYLTIPVELKQQLFPLLPQALLNVHTGFALALLTAVAAGGVFAYLCGFAIAKLSSATIPIATLGLLIIVNSLLIGGEGFTRGSQAIYGIPKSSTLPVIGLVAIIAIALAAFFKESATGLSLRAAREDEPAASSSGVDVAKCRHIAWTLSGAIAASSGALMAHHLSVFSPKDFYFDQTFALIVMLIVGGMYSVSGAVAGTVAVTAIMELLRRMENGVAFAGFSFPQVFGLTTIGLALLVMLTLYFKPSGLLGYREVSDLLRRRKNAVRADSLGEPVDHAATSKPVDQLSINRVSKSYGGVKALADVSLQVSSGEIVGLIGPNGSGKSTLLACISGIQQATSGSIVLGGVSLTGKPARSIARSGLARNFQNIRLFQNLSAIQNVVVSVINKNASKSLSEAKRMALELLTTLGIADLAERRSGDFAYGQQRRVEIARALALQPRFLLLDEPAAGMNETETMELLLVLSGIVRKTGIGLIIIDHDIPFIMKLCDRVLVLHQGSILAEGKPEEIQNSQAVKEAYFGRRRALNLHVS